jgi:hypothetical protein
MVTGPRQPAFADAGVPDAPSSDPPGPRLGSRSRLVWWRRHARRLAGQPSPEQRLRPSDRSQLVRVDVCPTARAHGVGDLRRDEFQILEDRPSQAIDQFSPIVIRRGSPSRGPPRTPEKPAATDRGACSSCFSMRCTWTARPHGDRAPPDRGAQAGHRPGRSRRHRQSADADRTMTFTRLTTVERAEPPWGLRDRVPSPTPPSGALPECYPAFLAPGGGRARLRMAKDMILRRRERRAFDALEGW